MIYFDHAATAGARPDCVLEAMIDALRNASANPGRSAHRISLRAARLVEEARHELTALFGVPDPSHLIFTKSATEAINLVLFGRLSPGDLVLASSWEHNAVLRPLRHLERVRGIRVELIPQAEESPIDLGWLDARLDRAGQAGDAGRCLVALTAASNVTGEILPVGAAASLCRKHGAFLLADGAQAAGVCDLDVDRDGIDALAVAGHKSLFGPTGTGALFLRDPSVIEPLLHGGTGSRSESEEQPAFAPDKFEGGTPNIPGLAGLAAGVRHVRSVGLDAIRKRHAMLAASLSGALESVPGLRLYGPADPLRRTAIACFTVDGLDAAEIAHALDQRDIFCRPGLQCAPRAHRSLGSFPRGTVRFSLSSFNTEAEIEAAAGALREIVAEVRPGS